MFTASNDSYVDLTVCVKFLTFYVFKLMLFVASTIRLLVGRVDVGNALSIVLNFHLSVS